MDHEELTFILNTLLPGLKVLMNFAADVRVTPSIVVALKSRLGRSLGS